MDDKGSPVWRARIAAYGFAHVDIGADFHQPLRWPGHYWDAETGLHENRFRSYSPTLGRYLQSDPSGLEGGLNLYEYTTNPVRDVDLRGLSTGCGGDDDEDSPRRPADGPDAEGTPPTRRPTSEETMARAIEGDDARFAENAASRAERDLPPISRTEWQEMANRIRDNQARGNAAESSTLAALGVQNNNSSVDQNGNPRAIQVHPPANTDADVRTRPDGVTPRTVVDVKSMPDDGPRVLYDSDQMDLQRQMAATPPPRNHAVVITNGDSSAVRPSEPLARSPRGDGAPPTTVYHREPGANGAPDTWRRWDPGTGGWGPPMSGPPTL